MINRALLNRLGVIAMVTLISSQAFGQKIVVAHRGASGYLPEHTLEAKAMAYAMGADYIEQDVVMTSDDQLIVLHDITLDRTTDVAEQFPERIRDDGRFYAIDFTLAEVKLLNASEGFRFRNGEKEQSYVNRFPMGASSFRVPTLAEEIELIQGLNKSTGRDVGIYPEVKGPEFHRAAGKDISTALIEMLKHYGYTDKNDKVFVQTFSFEELKIIHDEIMPVVGVELNLVQLVGGEDAYDWMFDAEGMATVGQYADGLGPEKDLIIDRDSTADNLVISDLVELAHANGMQVHPYTFRLDPGQLPAHADSFEQMLEQYYFEAHIDGVFTDFPDRAADFLKTR
jgi:glycerophosphoryl diester phosphodiesterase